MSLSPKQSSLYWKQWSAVCEFMGWKQSDDNRRYALHSEAGCVQSKTKFDNQDFDRYLTYCARLMGRKNFRDRDRERLVWRVREDAKNADLSKEYLQMLSRDMFGLGCWEELALDDLEKFRNTVHNRAYSKNPEDVGFIPAGPLQYKDAPFNRDVAPVEHHACEENEAPTQAVSAPDCPF